MVQVDEAISGEQCLKMITNEKYDMIFLDYRMPGMDGIETLNQMKLLEDNLNKEVPVIALTANEISGSREHFIQEGFDDYMSKPIEGERLEDLLRLYLPKSKIRKVERMRLEASDEQKSEVELSDWMDSSEMEAIGIDVRQGIKNCGSKEVYETVFRAFRNDINDRAASIREAYREKDWKQYAISVHAIKSSARIVGAIELSELAAELEIAADKEDVVRIDQDNDRILQMYERYLEMRPDQESEEKSGCLPMTEEMWIDACLTLRELASIMDLDNVLLVLDSLKEYKWPEGKQNEEEEIRALVSQLKWGELVEKLDAIR